MARSTLGADAAVRRYVLDWRWGRRQKLVSVLMAGDSSWGEYAMAELSKDIEPLERGEDTLIHRYELPDDHPVALRGNMSDCVLLGADDIVREL